MDVDNELISIATLLGGLIVGLSKRARARFGAAGLDITPDQFSLLAALARHGGQLTQSELGDLLDRDKSALVRQIDHLEEQGLVTRTVSSEDRRKKLLMLTPQGRRSHARGKAILEDMLRELFGGIPLQRLQSVRKGLEEMREKTQSS